MTIVELFAGKDEVSLIRWDTLFVLDLGLRSIGRTSKVSEYLDEYLHTAMEKGPLFLDVVVQENTIVIELFASKDVALLIGGIW